MNRNIETPTAAPASFNPADIYFVVFRHKWKIIILTLLGLAAATGYYFTNKPMYQSVAKIFIRYITDSQTLDPNDSHTRIMSLLDMSQNVMNSEMEILTSYDLAARVATNFGPDKVLAKLGGGSNAIAAGAAVKSHLQVEGQKDSSVIYATFRHADPDLVQPMLTEIIKDYMEKHVQVHSANGLTDEALQEKISELRLEISQTEDELRRAKTNAGIVSVEDTKKDYSDEMAQIRREIFQAETSLEEHQTSLRELTGSAGKGETNAIPSAPAETVAIYKELSTRLSALERKQNDYLGKGYTESNNLVRETRAMIIDATKTKSDLETRYPMLLDVDATVTTPGAASSSPTEYSDSVQVTTLPVRIKRLHAALAQIQSDAAKLEAAESQIADLERTKKIEEANFDQLAKTLEQMRIDQNLGQGRTANISVIQTPSPAYQDFKKFHKVVGMMAFSGLILGLIWAFMIEYYLDRSVKRPADLQSKLRIPFFLSIPDLNHNSSFRLAAPERKLLGAGDQKTGAATNGALTVATPAVNNALHLHYDALRDRLVNYFESINLTRKPKLVAITSAGKGAGVSTISAGLAASLSETGDGRVLLVDMKQHDGAAQQFVRGKAECKLDDALVSDKRDNALVQENLYVVSEGSGADNLPRVLPKRFASLVPKLKASDYDYIIFDMPPVSQTSVTTRLAGFMDTVMLVVEAEKTDRDVVQQANQLLQQAKANVSAVLNKTRNYVPSSLQRDINSEL